MVAFKKKVPTLMAWEIRSEKIFLDKRIWRDLKVLMFHTEEEGERDPLLKELQACVNLYYELWGDRKEWREVTKIKNPDVRPALLERVKRLLYSLSFRAAHTIHQMRPTTIINIIPIPNHILFHLPS